MTLFVVTLLTILVVEFTDSTEVEAHLTRNSLSLLQARYLARGGLALAELRPQAGFRGKDREPAPASQRREPSRPVGAALSAARDRRRGGRGQLPHRRRIGALQPELAGDAPRRKPGRPRSPQDLFQGVLAALGLDINLLFPLVDWLDSDDEVSGKSGAEREYYASLKPPYEPRNGRLLNIEELQLVRGFGDLTREQWAALAYDGHGAAQRRTADQREHRFGATADRTAHCGGRCGGRQGDRLAARDRTLRPMRAL